MSKANSSYAVGRSRSEPLKLARKYRVLLLMLVPGFIFLIIFNYIPMYGMIVAFKDFKITQGILGSPWAGTSYFHDVFYDAYFYKVLRNTVIISLYKLLFGFPAAVLFALLLNEIKHARFKKWVQTISYLPHFMSWIVLSGIFITIFSMEGPVNAIVKAFGHSPIIFMADELYFRPVLVITSIFQSFGWGAIIFLAAIAGIDPQLNEAAIIDGAGRFKRAVHITVPMLMPIITIMLILSMGGILNAGSPFDQLNAGSSGFDQINNMYSVQVYGVADIIDTYVYRKGLIEADYSYSAAVGVFKSVVSLILVLGVNRLAKKIGGNDHTLW